MAALKDARKMISIEPIMEFDPAAMVKMVSLIEPEFVSIGADSKGHGLKEPSWERVRNLIDRLGEITEVREKANLRRLQEIAPKKERR